MAVYKTLAGGMGTSTIRRFTQENFDDLVAQANDPAVIITDDALLPVGGEGKTEFSKACNVNFEVLADVLGTSADQSEGTLTMDTQPTAGDTMSIGTKVYTFTADGTAAADGEIDVGADLADAKTLVVAAINGTDDINQPHPEVTAGAFSGDDCVITATNAGVAGDLIGLAETFTAETNVFDATTMGTTNAGADGTIASLVTLNGGDSWSTIRTKLNTNFTLLDAAID